jgi:hypothetical protein
MRWAFVVAFSCSLFAACATATIPTEDDGGVDGATPKDAATQDVAKPNDAGTCTSPLTKCVADAGPICADLKSDPNHCGQCPTVCTTADAGSMQPGTNNPDSGVFFDGGYDAGIGWTLGTPGCDASTCAVTCPQGFNACSDGICYDPQNHHDHCGGCTTACQSTEWCTQGKCCSVGTEICGGTCTDVTSDKNNCGSCGNVCGSNTPVCSGGKCVSAVTFSQAFTTLQIATSQCTAWTTFRSQLTGTYSSITISGTNDTTGRTCTGTNANTLCQALHNNTATSVTCGSYTWHTDQCTGGLELTADNSTCTCANPGYNVRPCLNTNGDWGGVNTASCSAPSQTITVTCQ